jgi:hypothetical protein
VRNLFTVAQSNMDPLCPCKSADVRHSFPYFSVLLSKCKKGLQRKLQAFDFQRIWWEVQVSNLRPLQCECSAQSNCRHRGNMRIALANIIILVESLSNSAASQHVLDKTIGNDMGV